MIRIEIDEDTLLHLLVDRVTQWTRDRKIIELYSKMYENYIYAGVFEDMEFDIHRIVDNDYVNDCAVKYEGDEYYKEILEFYTKNGYGDCSCEIVGISYIEAENNGLFLIRY